MLNDDEFTGLYFLNCIRALPIFPISEPDPNKRSSLKPLAQGRRPKEEEEAVSSEFDETIMEYITAVASSKEAVVDNRTFESELQKMMNKGKAA
jgi:hypothetical protein